MAGQKGGWCRGGVYPVKGTTLPGRQSVGLAVVLRYLFPASLSFVRAICLALFAKYPVVAGMATTSFPWIFARALGVHCYVAQEGRSASGDLLPEQKHVAADTGASTHASNFKLGEAPSSEVAISIGFGRLGDSLISPMLFTRTEYLKHGLFKDRICLLVPSHNYQCL